MADAAVTFLLEILGEWLTQKSRELSRSRNEVAGKINQVEDLLKMLPSNSRERPQTSNDRIRRQRETNDIIYRFATVKENFGIVVATEGGCFRRFSKKLICVRIDLRDIYAEIIEIENKINVLLEIDKELSWRNSAGPEESSSAENESSQTDGHQQHFVGMEDEIEQLRSYIEKPQHRVIGICGMGGLGKTAVAKRMFNDRQVKNQFDAVAWVHVSQDFQPRMIFEHLYRQLYPHYKGRISDIDEAELGQRVHRIQQESRCLIVLDGLWSADAWQTLQIAFPSGETGSKILITTRVKQVVETAEIVAARRYIHKLRCLTPDEGCELFMNSVFSTGVPDLGDNRIVEEMGKEMAKCCEGLPLAILDFVGFMATKHSLEEWEEVHENLQSSVSKSQELGATLQSLALSYDNLPHFLRSCFLYLGYLQENSRIEAEKLYLLWLAEGFISLEDNGKDEILLNAAERYLDELEQRSMVEVHEEEVPTVTRLNSCQLSELIRELSLAKSKDDEFFKVVDFGCGAQQVTGSSSSCRLSINLDKYEHTYGFKVKDAEKTKMRCLLISAKENQQKLVWPQWLSSLVKLQSLRVLDFMGIPFQETKLPKGIGLLVHLRYLSFRGCNLPKLPSSIRKLKFLYVLDLRVTNKMIIPDILWKLKKLKHLYFPLTFETDGAPKLRLDSLIELETVTNLDVHVCNVSDLLHCYNLRYLALSVTGSLEEIERIVERMSMNSDVHFLRTSLEVREFDCYTEERISVLRQLLGCQSLIVLCLGGHIGRLPPHDEISSNLAKIVLIGSELMEDPMITLEKLPSLRVLELDVDAFKGKEMTCSASGFTELRRLKLSKLRYLEKWIVKDGAMPRLSTLTIVNCEKLIMLPEELQFIHHLQQMTVSAMHKKFKDSIQMVKGMMDEGMYQVKHVPSITIED